MEPLVLKYSASFSLFWFFLPSRSIYPVVFVCSLYPVTLADWTSGFKDYPCLLMSPELTLLFLIFCCMISYLHILDFILFLKMLFL